MNFRPILGVAYEKLKSVKFPVIASSKIDGIRCLTLDRADGPNVLCLPVCRSLKPIPNIEIRTKMGIMLSPGLDGELVTYTNGKLDPFYGVGGIQSKIMAHNWHNVEFKLMVFDYCHHLGFPHVGFTQRLRDLNNWHSSQYLTMIHILEQHTCNNLEELEEFEARCVAEGHEGICFRTPDSPYKFGRSSPKEQYLVKMKRFQTSEAEVIGVYEEMANNNPTSLNALGYAERSSHKKQMVGKGTLGGLEVRTPEGVEFSIGSGFNAIQRDEFWKLSPTLIGKIVQYKHQPHGAAEKPRIPIFLGFRDSRDMSPITKKQQELDI